MMAPTVDIVPAWSAPRPSGAAADKVPSSSDNPAETWEQTITACVWAYQLKPVLEALLNDREMSTLLKPLSKHAQSCGDEAKQAMHRLRQMSEMRQLEEGEGTRLCAHCMCVPASVGAMLTLSIVPLGEHSLSHTTHFMNTLASHLVFARK